MTIHNLKFQGCYDVKTIKRLSGLPDYYFTPDKLEGIDLIISCSCRETVNHLIIAVQINELKVCTLCQFGVSSARHNCVHCSIMIVK